MTNAFSEREREREREEKLSKQIIFRIRQKANTGPIFWQKNRESGLCFYAGLTQRDEEEIYFCARGYKEIQYLISNAKLLHSDGPFARYQKDRQ